MKGSTKSIAALLLLVLLTAAGCSAAPQDAAYRQISMKEAAELMETQEDFILLDVRTEEEFAEQHIPGAICIPNEEIGAEEPPPSFPTGSSSFWSIAAAETAANRRRKSWQSLAIPMLSSAAEFRTGPVKSFRAQRDNITERQPGIG